MISKTVWASPQGFKPIFYYLVYNDAFTSLSVVRNKLKLKPKPDGKSMIDAELEAKSPKQLALPP